MRPSWDEYFVKIAQIIAERSQCLRKKCGAVITSRDHRILATGYNNPPPGVTSCEEAGDCLKVDRPNYGPSCRRTIHAEMSALLYIGDRHRDAYKLYLTGTPCINCLEYVLKFGIKEIICGAVYTPATSQQVEQQSLLDAFGATIKYLSLEEQV